MIKIILHCSASDFGTALTIDKWHKERGWSGIGYHAVIMNGIPHASYLTAGRDGTSFRVKVLNGQIEMGRAFDADDDIDAHEQGAHAFGFNKDTMALCLIGNENFTRQQIISAVKVVKWWGYQFGVKSHNVIGHGELPGVTKTCPNIDMDIFRSLIDNKTEGLKLFKRFGNVKEVWE